MNEYELLTHLRDSICDIMAAKFLEFESIFTTKRREVKPRLDLSVEDFKLYPISHREKSVQQKSQRLLSNAKSIEDNE